MVIKQSKLGIIKILFHTCFLRVNLQYKSFTQIYLRNSARKISFKIAISRLGFKLTISLGGGLGIHSKPKALGTRINYKNMKKP